MIVIVDGVELWEPNQIHGWYGFPRCKCCQRSLGVGARVEYCDAECRKRGPIAFNAWKQGSLFDRVAPARTAAQRRRIELA